MSRPCRSHSSGRNHLPNLPHLHRTARRLGIYRRSLKVALVVGTLLNLINQPEVLFGLASLDFQGIKHLNLKKALLTYAVPFLVATYGALTAVHAQPVESPGEPTA
ncbi:MAG: hypothetical protein ACOYMG_17120 [Candidatus Methylumidiphilus sp.]